MSLFKAKELWHADFSNQGEEEFRNGSMAIGNLRPDSAGGHEQVVIGSLNGILRVFDPCQEQQETTGSGLGPIPFKPEHMLIERNMDFPIIHVAIGLFVSGSDRPSLAVLHPRKVSVFMLLSSDEAAAEVMHGSQYDLQRVYEHLLPRTAFNMVSGPFGGIKGRDFLCIQSLDGCVSVLEQESMAFSRFLPKALIPGPLVYAPMSDSFITVNANWHVESYRYQNLAVATNSETKEEAASITSGKRVTPDWSYGLGEAGLEIGVIEMSPAQPMIMVLGERQLFCLTEGGVLRFIARLDYSPACFLPYNATSEGHIQYMVAAYTNTLMMYTDTGLRWAAQLTKIPVQIKRMNLGGVLDGVLVTLSADGNLTSCYLGTEPSLYGLPQTETRFIDYTEKQAELRKLQMQIRSGTEPAIELKASTGVGDELTMTVNMPIGLDEVSGAFDTEMAAGENVPSITIRVQLTTKVPLESGVQVFVRCPYPIVPHQTSFSFPSLSGQQELPITFFLRYLAVPASLEVDIEATYCVVAGIHKIVREHCCLPLGLVFGECVASKQAAHKVTLDSSKPTVALDQLYPEFSGRLEDDGGRIGFKAFGSHTSVSVLGSKNVQKYRVQSESLEWTWLLVWDLNRRLSTHFHGTSDFTLSFSSTLPLAEYFAILDRHFEVEKRMIKLEEIIGQRCAQLRAVQKQLLTKFKDTNPTPLAHLDALVDMTHRQVIKISDTLLELHTQSGVIGCALDATTRLLVFLLKLQAADQNVPDLMYKRLTSALLFHSKLGPSSQTWEERAEVAIVHLLSMISSKSSSMGGLGSGLSSGGSGKMTDTNQLKKHIALLFDKLIKGVGNVVVSAAAAGKKHSPAAQEPSSSSQSSNNIRPLKGRLETIVEDTNATDLNDTSLGTGDIPAGSTFGDISALDRAKISRQLSVDEDFAESSNDGGIDYSASASGFSGNID